MVSFLSPSMFFNSFSKGLTNNLSESNGEIPLWTIETYITGRLMSGSDSLGSELYW